MKPEGRAIRAASPGVVSSPKAVRSMAVPGPRITIASHEAGDRRLGFPTQQRVGTASRVDLAGWSLSEGRGDPGDEFANAGPDCYWPILN